MGNDSHHVYYANRGRLSVAPYCSLDVDDVNGYGPEHTSLSQLSAGTYAYAVHRYSSGALQTSQAVVEVYRQGSLIRTFTVPTSPSGTTLSWWHVFNIDGSTGNVQSVNRLDSLPPRPWWVDSGFGVGEAAIGWPWSAIDSYVPGNQTKGGLYEKSHRSLCGAARHLGNCAGKGVVCSAGSGARWCGDSSSRRG